MNCQNCSAEHNESLENCCWINCTCGKEICGRCGYAKEKWKDCSEGNDEDQYWCCRKCPECGLRGCGMCI